MSRPYVSVIVPVYNAEKYLPECVESIFKQSESNWQLILVNDGSTDSSADLCRTYSKQDPRIHYIEQKHAGVSAARNQGIAHTNGEWVTFVDSDDTLLDFALELPKEAPKECEIIVAGIIGIAKECLLDATGRMIPAREMQRAILNLAGFKKQYPDTVILNYYNNWSSCARFYKADLLQQNHIEFTQGLKLSEDLLFCLTAYRYVEHIWLNNSNIYFYRSNEGSACRRFRKDLIDNTVLLVPKVREQLELVDLELPFFRFVLDNLTQCCFRYYADSHSGLTEREAAKELKELCESGLFQDAIAGCNYQQLICGKRNRLYTGYTLFCLKHKFYLLLMVSVNKVLKRI